MEAPKPSQTVPNKNHLAWHKLEYYGFIHFTINTFTDLEWGYGDESPEMFNPSDFDAEQIASTFKNAGLKGLILTCKHHDGFCLWPSEFTEHSVKNSPWKEGKGDVVREISDACTKYGIKFGVYLSLWDRNHAEYGRPAYIGYFRNQLNELTTNYGELFEIWFDGANGGDGFYGGARESRKIDRKNYYDWQNTWKIVRKNQPKAVIFSDVGPDVRWVGNEDGIAGDPCWSKLTLNGLYPGMSADGAMQYASEKMVDAWGSDQHMLYQGDPDGKDWLPAECDVSIRPGWFYHTTEDEQVRTPQNLFDLYLKSIGRGASLLLNLPPDRRGLIHENDVQALMEFKELVDAFKASNMITQGAITVSNSREYFSAEHLTDGDLETYWATDENVFEAEIEIDFSEDKSFNVIGFREFIELGQRVKNIEIFVLKNGEWISVVKSQALGNQRFIEIEDQTTSIIKIRLSTDNECLAISEIGIYNK